MLTLIDRIKKSEGFRGDVYKCTEGFDTVGYGTRMPLSEDEAELLLMQRLNKKMRYLQEAKPIVHTLSETRQDVLNEMVYQMGVGGVLKFKKMWQALEDVDYDEAAVQMLDSRWARQTPNRSQRLAGEMKHG